MQPLWQTCVRWNSIRAPSGTIAAAIGNYGSETAAALGAFYRPNDDVMVNLSTAFGTGENW